MSIAQHYLLPKVILQHGLYPQQLSFHPQVVLNIIKGWCYHESGVRHLNRQFEKIARKYVN